MAELNWKTKSMSEQDKVDLNLEHLRGWIGNKVCVQDTVTADLVRKFCATFDLPCENPSIGQVVPRLLHFCLAQQPSPTGGLGLDGHPERGGFLPPVPLPRRMWAGGSVKFNGDLRIGDAVERTSEIQDVTFKTGRTGNLCFVKVQHRIEANGRDIIEESQDLVYREEKKSASPKASDPVQKGRYIRDVVPSAPLLFRYSALTFNAHRIHYDRTYATEVEGYPGLIVHGPVQATLLLSFAKDICGQWPSAFGFRSMSSISDDGPFFLHAEESDDKLKLWTARNGGPVAMSAEAYWKL